MFDSCLSRTNASSGITADTLRRHGVMEEVINLLQTLEREIAVYEKGTDWPKQFLITGLEMRIRYTYPFRMLESYNE